ncbi:MAG: hypothetical protein LBF60_07430 [Treponema sp.]|nr:hypothetical protein [Treponema sp.]
MPQRDAGAPLEFALKCRAFGADASEGTAWTIKNGLYKAPDDAPELDGAGVR